MGDAWMRLGVRDMMQIGLSSASAGVDVGFWVGKIWMRMWMRIEMWIGSLSASASLSILQLYVSNSIPILTDIHQEIKELRTACTQDSAKKDE
jgi:hypothetical protein